MISLLGGSEGEKGDAAWGSTEPTRRWAWMGQGVMG